MVHAESAWNVVREVNISRRSSTSGTTGSVTAAQYPDDWYGYYNRLTVSSLRIRLNSRRIAGEATNFPNFVRSVYVHEFGHAFNLADNPSTVSASIMKYSRNRNVMVSPQPIDRDAVSAFY